MSQETPSSAFSEVDLATLLSGENGAYVESLYEDYVLGTGPVPETWAELFESLTGSNGGPRAPLRARGAAAPSTAPAEAHGSEIGIFGLVNAYRTHGHLIADLDPLDQERRPHPYLALSEFALDASHLDETVGSGGFLGATGSTLRQLVADLEATYCGTLAIEFMEMRHKERRDWLIQQLEPIHSHPRLPAEERIRILEQVTAAERYEQFVHKRFLGQKRFSIEGGEALIPLMDAIVEDGADLGVEEMVIAMAHRGRLNVLAHTMSMPYRAILSGFQASLLPRDAQGIGDVKYHRGFSVDRTTRSGKTIHLSVCPNPSHLEAINPVAEGIVRAKQNYSGDQERHHIIPILIHGDSAFMGQGLVAETLALSELETYWTGGTIHIIVNNQIAFTTGPEDYRFTVHPSDMAKVIQAPVFHVNADDPEACVHAARLAIDFRQRFKEDVIIDLVCYRRYGHNEGDDPTFTQPLLYAKIDEHPRVGTIYTERLIAEGVLDAERAAAIEAEQMELLERELEASMEQAPLKGGEAYHGLWSEFGAENGIEDGGDGVTAISREMIDEITRAMLTVPEGFAVHPKVRRLLERRVASAQPGGMVDWGGAEALALGSLVVDGATVRMTGQDVERGTFSHRHAVLHDVERGHRYVPLNALRSENARFIISNSMLSEAAVLGFEYGYSTVDPRRLAIWEAQYGDFANGAQVIIDQFVSSAERKWGRSSGLVMLLPHGMEGQGPEHSSARLERFLQLCAQDNIRVCNLTTPAQYFHALRRQMAGNVRKPLVLMSPKSLLRLPAAQSPVEELERGEFAELLDDPARAEGSLDPKSVRRVLISSGKVYYTLLAAREEHAFDDVALVRLEQVHPFPFDALRETLARYRTQDFAWVQEEPWNMGAWAFVRDRVLQVLPSGGQLRYVGRPESPSPATGSFKIHEQEEAEFVQEAFARRARRLAS